MLLCHIKTMVIKTSSQGVSKRNLVKKGSNFFGSLLTYFKVSSIVEAVEELASV
jgi:hypothetical protein